MANPFDILSTVIKTTAFLIDWTEAHKSRETVIADIQQSLLSIHTNILLHISALPNPNPRIIPALEDLYVKFKQIQQDLEVWEESRKKTLGKLWAFVNPWAVLDQLKQDKQMMRDSIQILTITILLVAVMPETDPVNPMAAAAALKTPSLTTLSGNPEVRKFWDGRIGENSPTCSADQLVRALAKYLNRTFKENATKALLLRLDEYDLGTITLSAFDRFVCKRSLLDALNSLDILPAPQGNLRVPVHKRTKSDQGHLRKETESVQPLLLVIDDEPGNIQLYDKLSQSDGIKVNTFLSTTSAKSWIDSNEAILRKADMMSKLRVIIDDSCWEPISLSSHVAPSPSTSSNVQPGKVRDLRVGESFLRYLRGQQYTAPVLVTASQSIASTTYVSEYTKTGSTSSPIVRDDFISALAGKIADDEWWLGCDVRPKAQIEPLLVWIDDELEKREIQIKAAKKMNLRVVALDSTEKTKAWMLGNKLTLRRMDNANLLRFISDNTRIESPRNTDPPLPKAKNHNAGKELIQFIRDDQGYRAPILIYCWKTGLTTYVEDWKGVGSTTNHGVLQVFFEALAERRMDDEVAWAKVGATLD
ncbi:hypothetical protein DL96DRAFT_1765669 [Flagelloscypha sp. PMI_526]|nr:hypothetical protein DL96DRAFT_1765669 [Flagelloscypha sp. PMI_526]